MTNIYERMAAVSNRRLSPATSAPGTFGQETIELVRITPGAAPANPWDAPNPPVQTRTKLKGASFGVSKELVGTPVPSGGAIVATDLYVIVAPWGGEYEPADMLELNGAPVTILRVENIPAFGTVSAIRFFVRQ